MKKNIPFCLVGAVLFTTTEMSGATHYTLSAFNGCLKLSNTTCTLASSSSNYDVNSPAEALVVTGSNLTIEGEGYSYPTIRRNSASVTALITFSGASYVTMRRLRIDGNNAVFGATTHSGLKQFLTASNTHDFRDVFLTAGYSGITLTDNRFVNSSRYAIYLSGNGQGPNINNNTFTLGLDAAFRTYVPGGESPSTPFITGLSISGNNFYGYRGAGIVLEHVSNSVVSNNGLTWCHSGDVWGGDIDAGLQGGGQIYSAAHSKNNQITGNQMDGRSWQGYQSPNNNSGSLVLNNYGIEIDSNHSTKDTTMSNNVANYHSVAGFWIAGGVSGIVLDGNESGANRIHGIILEDLTNPGAVKIRGGNINNNWGASQWPNGATPPAWPIGHGVFLNRMWTANAACIGNSGTSNVVMSLNPAGDIGVKDSVSPAYSQGTCY